MKYIFNYYFLLNPAWHIFLVKLGDLAYLIEINFHLIIQNWFE